MSANLEAKKQVVEEIKEKIQNSKSVVLVASKGLSVAEDTELRREFRAKNVEYKVLKNTLVRRAFNDLGINDFDEDLNGPTTVAFGADVSVSSLSFEGHPSIRIGSGVSVSVAGGVDLAGVTVDADIVAGGWTTVMEADRVEGMPSVPAGRLVRVVPTSGGYALQLKRLAGSIISIQ